MDAFERFEARVSQRAFGSFIGGGIGLALIAQSPLAGSALMLVYLVVWLIITGYFASKMRGKHEALPAYQRRVGYKDP